VAGKKSLDAQLVVDLFKNSIAQILQADFGLVNLDFRIENQLNRLSFPGFFLNALTGNDTE